MGCSGCSPLGCGDKGHCSTGSCNKMNSYDWINTLDIDDPTEYQYIEVSFKNGARKEFFLNDHSTHCNTGDLAVVEAPSGYDIGTITLSGELVRMQMKKKHTTEDRVLFKVIRKANERDVEKLAEARKIERSSMIRARAIAATLGLDMKLGDVEYQGDLKKATFFYTANGRVDFRELVRSYAKEFRVKIEMRQIGSRQESARIGGIGSCGRELCCSTWLADFRSVNTAAARYQNIAINQTKLSGQCGRLKCCLNYELDTYLDALKHFPIKADHLKTQKGRANLVKTDIFKGIMFYTYEDISMRGVFHPLDKERVKEIQAMNAKGIFPEDLNSFVKVKDEVVEVGYVDVTGEIELPNEKRRKNKPRKGRPDRRTDDRNQNKTPQTKREGNNPQGESNQNSPQNKENTPGANQQKSGNQKGPRPNQNKGESRPPRPNNPDQQNNPRPKPIAGEQNQKTDQNNQRPKPLIDNTPPLTSRNDDGNASPTSDNKPTQGQNNKKKRFFKNKNKPGGNTNPKPPTN